MSSTPSPSFPKAVGSLLAFVFFPILALIWVVRCIARRNPGDAAVFLLYGVIGIVLLGYLALHFKDPARVPTLAAFGFLFFYAAFWACTLTHLRWVKDRGLTCAKTPSWNRPAA